jgi:hypothetical protein
MAFLTDQTLASGVTLNDLIHIVIPTDISQGNPAGSSYKATIEQVISGFTGTTLYEVGPGTDSTQRIGTSSDSSGNCSVVSGGISNTVLGLAGFVGGGGFNTVSGDRSVITGGGGSCPALGNKTLCNYNFIGGGIQNVVNGTFSSIVGGGSILLANGNIINSCYSTIVGGCRNVINHNFSTVIGSNISTQSACTVHINNLLIKNTPPQDQTATDYLVRDTISGMVKYKTIPGPTVFGLYAQTGNSITVSGTTSELSIIGPGVGTLNVPTNGFSVGDSFVVRVSGDLGANNGDDLTLRVKSGSAEFGVVGPLNMPNVTSSHFSFEVTFTIRAVGTAGNAKIQSSGFFTFTQNAGGTFEGDNFSTLNQTTFDTTIPNQLDITAQFNSTNAANFIFTEILVLNKIY